jgi:hypothetical protein
VFLNPQEEATWNFYKWMVRKVLPCRVIEIKQAEEGWRITTNFKVYSFANNIKIQHAEGETIDWKLKSASGT